MAATAQVSAMTSEFFSGLGPGNLTFGPGSSTSEGDRALLGGAAQPSLMVCSPGVPLDKNEGVVNQRLCCAAIRAPRGFQRPDDEELRTISWR